MPAKFFHPGMHLGALSVILFRYHDNKTIQNLLRRVNKEKLIGTECYSDPATGINNSYNYRFCFLFLKIFLV